MENQNKAVDENTEEYKITSFEEMFDQIGYAHEARYPSTLHHSDGKTYFTVYKLTICSEGWMEYKGQYTDFDVKLWPRIELLAKVMTNDPSINLFYLNENN